MKKFFHTRVGTFVLLVAFIGLAMGIGVGAQWAILHSPAGHVMENPSWRPAFFLWAEGSFLVVILAASILVALLGGRSMSDLGYSLGGFIGKLAAGSVWGLGMPTILVIAIALLGGFTFGSLAMRGTRFLGYAGAWLVVMFLLGAAEEAAFRGPILFLLRDAITFWPAAIVSSALFVLAHSGKPNENAADLLAVGLIGLFVCFTVKRTGSIWWAAGFHALFDYAALYMYGAPNSGNNGHPVATRLLTGSFHGPRWLTGGDLGMESSWLIFPLLAIVWTAFHFATIARTQKEEMPCGDSVTQPAR